MADQQQPMQPPEPPVSASADQINPEIEEALENAILRMAQKGAGSSDGRDAKDYAEAAVKFAQALILTNPELVAPAGIPMDAANPNGMLPFMPVDQGAGSARSVSGRSGPTTRKP